jgi:hypothetical protein
MARTKMTAKRYKHVTTWTRFHLPLEQEWPAWTVAHENVHLGPPVDVKGCSMPWLGRMVDDPEQVAFIMGECHQHRKTNCTFPD